jgi:hypothetical protein
MLKSTNISEMYLRDHDFRARAKKAYQLQKKNIEKIKRIAIRKVSYPELGEAYDYVDKLFPRAKVKEIEVFKVKNSDLVKMNFGGARGFYDTISKIVVLSGPVQQQKRGGGEFDVQAKVTNDEVIVHELCHYCYFFERNSSIGVESKEEFAYGWSLGYLREKGYSDDYIIRYNFLPFLMNASFDRATKNILVRNGISYREYNAHTRFKRKEFRRQYGKKIFLRAKEIAIERGQALIDCYSKKLEEGSIYADEVEDNTRWDLLDI